MAMATALFIVTILFKDGDTSNTAANEPDHEVGSEGTWNASQCDAYYFFEEDYYANNNNILSKWV